MQMEQSKKSLNDFSLIIVIGKGSYGKVVLVKEKATNEIFAMKILKKKHIRKSQQIEHIITERNILVKIKHPFIVRLAYSFQDEEKLFFVMEYCPGGELFNLLSSRKKFTEDQTRFYAAQIILAIEELHKHNTIYRDLKPENVLIDRHGYLKIADFGLSKNNINDDKGAKSVCGTPEYLAPEVLLKEGHGKPVDWWALGAIIFEMLTGLPPFYTENREELFERIKYKELDIPKTLTKPCVNVLIGLFQKDPRQRLGSNGADEIKKHPWFINVNWNILIKKQYKPPYVPVVRNEVDTQNFDKEFLDCPIDSYKNNEMDSQQEKVYIDFSYMGSRQDGGLANKL
ncbi:Protein kinase-like domain [Pseudocohnilembus persalinus]|uniref:non-specific serine/threonine protein kinase n=1 Tax=Pseudocohnilembus persalinus TaxID=266149 RepID=A0A0V0QJU1_PSEPJ|nr:Protein kinase-like domain [Pseudocohnilembus persalinus]|eukprot:KRX02245.1 Protein kinase-like domain [Pseudocohnilembus persalinus]